MYSRKHLKPEETLKDLHFQLQEGLYRKRTQFQETEMLFQTQPGPLQFLKNRKEKGIFL